MADRLRLTAEGWLRLDALVAHLTRYQVGSVSPYISTLCLSQKQLSEREFRVLEAVVQTYIETAEPAGSQTIARRFGLGVSPATIRNTMSELEDKGYLFHPHTSAGRIPTDRAYRVYVNEIMRLTPPSQPGAAHPACRAAWGRGTRSKRSCGAPRRCWGC